MTIAPGQTVGQYVVKAKIGQGGMGAVYTAEQPAVRRTVVLKLLSANFSSDPSALDRFRRELDIIAQLEHPYILPVYDFGEVEGKPYIVMRYMAGGSMLERMRAGTLSRTQLLHILDQVSQALDYAHQRDIIHRDLKPANILLDDRGNAYLADFGLAKTMEGSRDLTATGSILGTPAYMSPEQARGEKLDSRSDVYALAVLAYEALAGRQPFKGKTPWEYIHKHLVEAPPPITTVAPELPPAVEEVLNRALAKDREPRPGQASEFVGELRAALSGAAEAAPGAVQAAAHASTRAAVVGPTAPPEAPTGRAETRQATAAAPTVVRPSSAAAWALPAVGLLVGGGLLAVLVIAVVAIFVVRSGGLAPRPAVYPVGDSPRALLYDGESIWVANFFDSTVTRLAAGGCDLSPDPCGQALGTYSVDQLPVGLAFDGQSLWVASALNGTLAKLNPATGAEVARYRLPNVPSTLLLAHDHLWTANSFANTITKVGLDGTVVGDYAVGQGPLGIVSDGQTLWVANQTDKSLSQVDPGTGNVIGTLQVGGQPDALAFDGRRIWAALGDQNQVVEIDPVSSAVVRKVDVGQRPLALLYDGTHVWSANESANSLDRIDVQTATATQTIAVAGGPFALAWVPCGAGCGDIWTANQVDDTVSRIRIRP